MACLGTLAMLAVLAPEVIEAQQPIGGTVVNASGQRPIAGAQVVVDGTELGTITDNRGRFLILNVPGATVRLRVVMIGYRDFVETFSAGTVDAVLAIQETAIDLDEIIVTGTAGGQQTRELGNAIGKLSVADMEEVAPSSDLTRSISAQIPGVRFMQGGGEVGTGGLQRIRGVASLTISAEPLIVVDGVRVNGDQISSQYGWVGFDGRWQPSRFNDFNPDDIESIEVIKGPAAATLYGTEASNGVIQIITKRGRSGAPRVNMTIKQGANFYPDLFNLFPETYYRCSDNPSTTVHPLHRCQAGQITPVNVLKLDKEVYGLEWFRTGHAQSYGADVSGGSDFVTYFMSVDFDRDEGAVPYNWRNRLSGRTNLTYTPSDKFKFDFSLGAVRSKSKSASTQQPLPTAIIWACPAPGCEPGTGGSIASLDGDSRGYIAYLPEAYQDEIEGFQDVDRTTFSLVGTHNPVSWLTHRLTVGGDFTGLKNHELFRATGNYGNFGAQGIRRIANIRTTYVSFDYSANAGWNALENLSLETAGGLQFYRRAEEVNFGEGQNFPVVALETISSGANRIAEEDFLENRTFGVFFQEQLSWRDRVYITGAIRGDDNSAFGQNFDFVVYPKVSASYVISDEEFLATQSWLSTLKLRGAWGKAGQQPDVFDALRTYQPSVGPAGQGILTPQNIGNPDLKPEVGEEIEIGFDAGILDERVGIEFTWYRQKTKDALVRVPTLPSLGFPGVQLQNLGEMKNTGFEFGINANPYTSENLGIDLGFTASKNENEIVSLGGQPAVLQSATFGQFHVEGMPIGGTYFKRVVSGDIVGGSGANVMCESGAILPGTSNLSRGGGGPVACADAPLVYFGQPLPKWEGSASLTVSLFRNLQLYALADFITGRTLVLGDVAASHRFFLQSRAILERTDPILLGYEALGGEGLWQPGLVDGSFAKLRTVAASYTLPSSFAQRIGSSRIHLTVSAENLWTFWQGVDEVFGHPVYDLERSQNGGVTEGLNPYNQEGWPQLTRILSTLKISF